MLEKRILLIDNGFYNYGESIEYHMKNRGYNVSRFCIKTPLNFKIRVYNFLTKKIKEIFKLKKEFPLIKEQITAISQDILLAYEEFQPDYVIFIKADYINRDTLLKMQSAELIVWMMDSYARYPYLINDLDLFNHIFSFEESDINLLKEKGIKAKFLPLCADERIFYPQNIEKDIDILFIGAMYPDRVKLLKKIISEFTQYNIQVYGYYINRFEILKKIIYKHTNMHKIFHGRVSPQEANDLYARSKICINMHNWQTKNGANPRTFEILATNSFEIVDYNSYIEKEINDGVIIYRDEKDLFCELSYYLQHEAERKQIADRGYMITKERHLFSNRVECLLEGVAHETDSLCCDSVL